MIERLDFSENTPYSAVEAAIHLNRYAMARPYVEGKRVLDAASGEGYGSYLLYKWGARHVDAVDIDEPAVEKAKHYFGSEDVVFHCHTAEQLPFPDASFDVVCSFETIEHLDHPEAFLQEIKRVLRPGGTIVLSCPNDPYYYKEGTPGNPFHKKQYTFYDFKTEAERYLGAHVKYFLAFALNGFLNMPLERATFPPEGDAPSPLANDMFEMLNYNICDSAAFVAGERYLNYWNSNYYVGVWGPEVKNNINAAIFPRETFIEVKDEDIELLRDVKRQEEHIRELEKSLREQEDIEAYVAFVKENAEQQLHVAKLESERISMMLELTTKEKEALAGSYAAACGSAEQARQQLEQARQEAQQALEQARQEAQRQLEQARREAQQQLEQARQQQEQTQQQLEQVRQRQEQTMQELELIKASRGFKLLNMGFPIKQKIWKLFGKNI